MLRTGEACAEIRTNELIMLTRLLRRIKQGMKRSHAVAKEIPPESYWTDHNVTSHKSFGSARESLDYFHWRNDQYIDYIELLPVIGHDGEVIVDFGCGPGHDLVGFHAYSKPKRVYGIDISSSSLAQARQRLALHDFAVDLLEIYEADGFIPLTDGSVDYVHCSGVLNHVESPEAVLKEFHRILKPGGYVRLMVYNQDSIWVHLYVAHILRSNDERFRNLSADEAFRRSTDGFDCPISRSWKKPQMLALAQSCRFEGRHLGNAASLFEVSILPQRFSPMMDPSFPSTNREFLRQVSIDARGIPRVDGEVAGIDGCYELRKRNVGE
jgi:ubiquinone/menaquinone biosynthesis C-methylase UbiE